MDDQNANAPPPILRGTPPSGGSEKPVEESSGVTAAEYRRAKLCAILLPVVVVVGSVAALVVGMGDMDNERGWTEAAQKVLFFVTIAASGYLATQATRLKMEPYRKYKRESDLAVYRRSKGIS